MCLGFLYESSEVFVRHQQSVGKGQVGRGTGAPPLAEPAGNGRPLICKAIYKERNMHSNVMCSSSLGNMPGAGPSCLPREHHNCWEEYPIPAVHKQFVGCIYIC